GPEPRPPARQPGAALRPAGSGTRHLRDARPRLPLAGRQAAPMRGGVNDWDAIMGEAALGLDLARVDSLRNGPGLALVPRARQAAVLTVPDTVPDDLETGPAPDLPPLDPGAIFR